MIRPLICNKMDEQADEPLACSNSVLVHIPTPQSNSLKIDYINQ